jgi:hypothetical protein
MIKKLVKTSTIIVVYLMEKLLVSGVHMPLPATCLRNCVCVIMTWLYHYRVDDVLCVVGFTHVQLFCGARTWC